MIELVDESNASKPCSIILSLVQQAVREIFFFSKNNMIRLKRHQNGLTGKFGIAVVRKLSVVRRHRSLKSELKKRKTKLSTLSYGLSTALWIQPAEESLYNYQVFPNGYPADLNEDMPHFCKGCVQLRNVLTRRDSRCVHRIPILYRKGHLGHDNAPAGADSYETSAFAPRQSHI
nr:hypothetical protein CFP56_03211 [Quercus suber]